MAIDVFLKLEGIDGESQDTSYTDWIDIISWNWGATQSGSFHEAGGGGAGKAAFQDLSVTKFVDKSSHKLLSHLSKGTHIDEGKIIVRKAGDSPIDYLTITMNPCIISSISTGGSEGEEGLIENITINFKIYEFAYTPQNEDGSAGSVLPFKFNIAANAEE